MSNEQGAAFERAHEMQMFHRDGDETKAGYRLWSAKSALSMKADQIAKIGLILVFFLLKSLHFMNFPQNDDW